jgi:hypothetical protein
VAGEPAIEDLEPAENGGNDFDEDTLALFALLKKGRNKHFRTYELKRENGRVLLERAEFCRIVDEALGIEPEPGDQDGFFLDDERKGRTS